MKWNGKRQGFTLLELIVAMAISLLLMVGIGAIFHMAAETVGTGIAITQMTQTSRAVQTALGDDWSHAHATTPVFTLANYGLPGSYLNAADQSAYPSFNQPAAGTWDPIWYGHYNRCDKMSFFVSGETYSRQTGDWPSILSSTTSPEAYVSYGLLRQYNNGPVFGTFYPGSSNVTNNPNNFYSNNWILGRNAMLLVDYSQTYAYQPLDLGLGFIPNGFGYGAVLDNVYYARPWQHFLQYPNDNPLTTGTTMGYNQMLCVLGYLDGGLTNTGGLPQGSGAVVAPISRNSDPNASWAFDPWNTQDPTTAYPNNPTQGLYWSVDRSRYDLAAVTTDEFRTDVYQVSMTNLANIIPGYAPSQAPLFYANPTAQAPGWWTPLVLDGLGEPFLFECKMTKPAWTTTINTTQVSVLGYTPLQSQTVALQAPVLAAHVSNFIVEYAGDYLTQTNTPGAAYGTVTGAGGDGTVDYTVDANGSRHIRWYGLTRSSRSDGNFDVQPLRTVLASVGGQPAAFEVDNQSNPNLYICVWRGTMPAMIRVTMKVEDPTNHLQSGRWYEFVMTRPGGVIN